MLNAPRVDAFGQLAARVLEAAGDFDSLDQPRAASEAQEHLAEETRLYPSWD